MRYILLTCALFFFSTTLVSADEDKKIMAVNMVERAIQHYKMVGKEEAFQAFQDKQGAFVQGELYVVVLTEDGLIRSHPHNSGIMNNPSVKKVKLPDGRVVTDSLVKSSLENPEGGWFSYRWSNPETKNMGNKTAFSQAYDKYTFSVGYYE